MGYQNTANATPPAVGPLRMEEITGGMVAAGMEAYSVWRKSEEGAVERWIADMVSRVYVAMDSERPR